SPACSKTRFLLPASRSTATLAAGSSFEIRLMLYLSPCAGDPRPPALSAGEMLQRGAAVAVRLGLFLVLDDGAVELVDESVDRRVHVVVRALAEHVPAEDVYAGLHLVEELLDRQDDVDLGHMIEMMGD